VPTPDPHDPRLAGVAHASHVCTYKLPLLRAAAYVSPLAGCSATAALLTYVRESGAQEAR
jgi:hypothetical protein